MNRNSCFNLLKCAACFGVVFMHVKFPGTTGNIVERISSFAVPLFVMIAGYYSYGCDEGKIKKRFIKIVKIFIFGYLCFFIYNIALAINNHTLLHWLSTNYNWKNPIIFFAFCTVRWAGPLWYLIGMAETYLFWIFIIKKGWQEKVCKLTLFLFLVRTLLTIAVEFYEKSGLFNNNFIIQVLPWFMLGYKIKDAYEIQTKQIHNIKLWILVFVGLIISLSSIFFRSKINYCNIGVLLTAPALFLIGVKNTNIKVNSFIEFLGDKLSLFIYILHPLISPPVIMLVEFLSVNKEGIYLYIHPIITLIATIIISFFFHLIFKNKKLRRLLY